MLENYLLEIHDFEHVDPYLASRIMKNFSEINVN